MGMSYLYSSTDTSAPALIDGVGYLVQVLDKVLVEGYGDKSGLGWTKEYNSPDGKIVCYRNKGTGFFLRVDNSVNYHSAGVSAKIEVYEVMSGYDKGYLRIPEENTNHYCFYANTKTNARNLKWFIIGDDKGFWFVSEYATTANQFSMHYFGDYTAYDLQNKSNWITVASTNIADSYTRDKFIVNRNTANADIRIARDYNNQLPVRQIGLIEGNCICNPASNISKYLGTTSYQPYSPEVNYTYSVTPILTTVYLSLYDSTTPTTNYIIGELTGCLSCFSYSPSGSIIQKSNNSQIYVFWTGLRDSNEICAKMGIIVGEGFRP